MQGANNIGEEIVSYLGFPLSETQRVATNRFFQFLSNPADSLFLLRGYAGTGKTSLVSALVNILSNRGHAVALLAPTGRAAKVFTGYSAHPAMTIHKCIYRLASSEGDLTRFKLFPNKNHHTLYFVDEASMIGGLTADKTFGSGSLLDDLFRYVYNGNGNRLILIGDTAQLPPVGLSLSPALDGDYWRRNYALDLFEADLTEVMRQAEDSGILWNATTIRQMIGQSGLPKFRLAGLPDICRIEPGELVEQLEESYSRYGDEETMVLCRSNKRANRYNAGIRSRLLYREEDLSRDDRVMIVRNNYFWGDASDESSYIANGEMATIQRVTHQKEIYGLQMAEVWMQLWDGEEITPWVILDTLSTEQSALSEEARRKLYAEVSETYADLPTKAKRMEAIRNDEYYNALEIKFAYAITCHKAQGGQWDCVFVDPGFIDETTANDEYWRWLYTAFTRARKKLILVNFKAELFEK